MLSILRKIEDEDPAAAGDFAARDAVVMKALAKDRERRYQTAAELAEAIRGWMRLADPTERPVDRAGARRRRRAERRPRGLPGPAPRRLGRARRPSRPSSGS